MPDLDHLDRALDGLARDFARTSGPGATMAVATARRRRRRKIAAVCLASIAVVGGSLAAPQSWHGSDGTASEGGSQALDAPAMEDATSGWLDGWTPGLPNGAFSAASCMNSTSEMPEAENRGTSWFSADGSASAVVEFSHYPSSGEASDAAALKSPAPDSCGPTTTIEVDGIVVRHDAWSIQDSGPYLTDTWSVQLGADLGQIDFVSDAGAADAASTQRVAEALVAGLRSGQTQATYLPDPNASEPTPSG